MREVLFGLVISVLSVIPAAAQHVTPAVPRAVGLPGAPAGFMIPADAPRDAAGRPVDLKSVIARFGWPADQLRRLPDQDMTAPPPFSEEIDLSGPRFGFTMLSQGMIDKIAEKNIELEPMISQFGWQFERQLSAKGSGVSAVSEWVVLLGGLDQGVALPSLSWLVGVRNRSGAEFGLGPNITPAGVALVLTAGVTMRAGALNVPVNFAVVPSKYGTRVTVLTGFTMRQR